MERGLPDYMRDRTIDSRAATHLQFFTVTAALGGSSLL
jgi:hypothetical protein